MHKLLAPDPYAKACVGFAPSSSPRSASPSGPKDDRLRHPRFLGLRRDKPARKVVKEQP